jgi:beta-lactamase class D
MKPQLVILLAIYFASCINVKSQNEFIFEKKEWEDFFKKRGLEGTFVLYNLKKKEYFVYNPERANQSFLPASTFKIINSLIALETGAIIDEREIIEWDEIDRGWENWNRDQNMLFAFRNSTVWFYQELARRIGEEKMQYWVNACEYGNKNISGGIDLFWLQGEIRISAMEQIDFLKKLVNNDLFFNIRNQELVKEIMLADSSSSYRLYAKTGWAARVNPQIGWYVGFIETDTEVWLFANNITIEENSQTAFRIEITNEILKAQGIIPEN